MHLAILVLVTAAGHLALEHYALANIRMSCFLVSRCYKTSVRLCAPAAGRALSSRSSPSVQVNCKVASQMAPGKLLANKVCVITGGGRGIGAAIAEKFAAEGATLVLTARSEDQLQKVNVYYGICSVWHNRNAESKERHILSSLHPYAGSDQPVVKCYLLMHYDVPLAF